MTNSIWHRRGTPRRPGAVLAARGVHRPSEAGMRERIDATGNFEAARLELRRTYIRRARLEAELDEQKAIALPRELANEKDIGSLLAEEATILITRRDALQSQLTALSELRSLYEKEIASLESKRVTQAKQVALAQRELNNVGSLVDKGLAVTSRQFALERTTAELQSALQRQQGPWPPAARRKRRPNSGRPRRASSS